MAFGAELAAGEALDLLRKAPDPDTAATLSLAKITAALRHAGRRKIDERARKVQEDCAQTSCAWRRPCSGPTPRPCARSSR